MCTGHKVDAETVPLAGTLGLQTFKPGWAQEFRNLRKLTRKQQKSKLRICDPHSNTPWRLFFCHFVIVILLLKALEGDAEAPGKPQARKDL